MGSRGPDARSAAIVAVERGSPRWTAARCGMSAGLVAIWRYGCGLEAWMRPCQRCEMHIQNLSQVSLYLQSSPYLMIMHNSHLQTEICIDGAFKKSKIVSVRALMIIVIIVIAKKSFGDVARLMQVVLRINSRWFD